MPGIEILGKNVNTRMETFGRVYRVGLEDKKRGLYLRVFPVEQNITSREILALTRVNNLVEFLLEKLSKIKIETRRYHRHITR